MGLLQGDVAGGAEWKRGAVLLSNVGHVGSGVVDGLVGVHQKSNLRSKREGMGS